MLGGPPLTKKHTDVQITKSICFPFSLFLTCLLYRYFTYVMIGLGEEYISSFCIWCVGIARVILLSNRDCHVSLGVSCDTWTKDASKVDL